MTAAVTAVPARAQPPGTALHLLDVPYLPQSEALCGGAAVAMVMRFFGETGIYAETFAGLVDRDAGGIRGQDLIDALRARGWQAQSFSGDAALVRSYLDAGRPVIALIQDRPGRFHYVVLVGWDGGRVIVHDPARAPFRLLEERAFTEAWSASGFWTLVAGPPPAPATALPPVATLPPAESLPTAPASASPTAGNATPPRTPCDPMVQEAVRLAGAGALDGGRALLEVAAAACPLSASPWREMAGLHALKNEWREAAQDARRALANDAADPLALRILATSLFLDGDADGALAAWNRLGQPIIDLITVTGLERTRYLAVTRGIGLRPQQLLTRAALQAARRRLGELPAAQSTRLAYRPAEHGTAQVDAAVLERPLVPSGFVALAAIGVHAVSDRELAASLSSPSGGGELATLSWRWWEHRPRVGGRFAAPAPFGGVWAVDGFTERQSYAGPAAGAAVVEEARRRVAIQVANWTERGLRWEVTSGLDVWDRPRRRAFSLGLGVEQRLDGDRVSLRAGIDAWTGGLSAWGTRALAEWRSATTHEGTVWLAQAGIDQVADSAPRALWAGAGTGQGRDALLRAHPLLDDGVIRDGVFGRRLLHGGVEGRHWLRPRGVIRLAPAVFLDAARAGRGLRDADPAGQVDAGVGLRIAVPGAGVVRVDYARGLRERAGALSIGWTR
ncbi:MAG: C39 family peptidase [Acidobacteriota bacterium]